MSLLWAETVHRLYLIESATICWNYKTIKIKLLIERLNQVHEAKNVMAVQYFTFQTSKQSNAFTLFLIFFIPFIIKFFENKNIFIHHFTFSRLMNPLLQAIHSIETPNICKYIRRMSRVRRRSVDKAIFHSKLSSLKQSCFGNESNI